MMAEIRGYAKGVIAYFHRVRSAAVLVATAIDLFMQAMSVLGCCLFVACVSRARVVPLVWIPQTAHAS
jgi:hypothetical protein